MINPDKRYPLKCPTHVEPIRYRTKAHHHNPQYFDDFQPRTQTVNKPLYRIKYKPSRSSRSQNGKTVYEIYNIKSRPSESQFEETEKLSHLTKHQILKNEEKIEDPKEEIPKKTHNFMEIVWEMNELKEEEEKVGEIKRQIKQNPLSPNEPQNIQIKKKEPSQQKQKIIVPPDHEISQLEELKTGKKKKALDFGRNVVDYLNSSTKYIRYKHTERIKEKFYQSQMLPHQSIQKCKDPSKAQTISVQVCMGDPVEKIANILHYDNERKIQISIKLPLFFHSPPDELLPDQQLAFKGLFDLQSIGIQNITSEDIEVTRHPQCFMYSVKQETNKVCINWYKDSSVYCGQVSKNLRDGVGMQWVPGVYLYYGQYHKNYRHGYGIMKYSDGRAFVGVWGFDRYHGLGKLINEDGVIIQRGTYRHSHLRKSSDFRQLL